MVNPYTPQHPADPRFFGGRKSILQSVAEQMEKARILRQSGGILVHGFRGVGKTSLIDKIVDMAESSSPQGMNGVFIARRVLTRTISDAELYQFLTEALMEDIAKRQTPLERLGAGFKIRSVGGGPFKIDFEEGWKQKSPYQQWRAVANALTNASFILVAIDDADYLAQEAVRTLKTLVEEQKDVPLLLVVAAGPTFEERLMEEHSPVRVFSGTTFNVSNFELDETCEVLQTPLKEQPEASWSEDGMNAVQRMTKGYPFLVQCLASASYQTGPVIDAARVKASIQKALPMTKSSMENKLREASEQDILSFYKISRSGRTSFRSSELYDLGIQPPYIGRLQRLKVLKLVRRGHYDLIEAPMVAYYHMLKLGLPMEEK